MFKNKLSYMIVATPSVNNQTVIAQVVAPTGVRDRAALDSWLAKALPGAAQLGDSVTVTTYELGDAQLLPHRAARFGGRYSVLYEAPDLDGLAALLQGTSGGGAESEGAGIVVFRQTFETRTATTLPEGVVPPTEDSPQGPPGVFLAWTRPVNAEADEDYNRWYDDWHCPETLHMKGFYRGRRGKKIPEATTALNIPEIDAPYLTVYDIDSIGGIPFARDVLVPWLSEVGVDHLGPESYDRAFTQAFIFADLDGESR